MFFEPGLDNVLVNAPGLFFRLMRVPQDPLIVDIVEGAILLSELNPSVYIDPPGVIPGQGKYQGVVHVIGKRISHFVFRMFYGQV